MVFGQSLLMTVANAISRLLHQWFVMSPVTLALAMPAFMVSRSPDTCSGTVDRGNQELRMTLPSVSTPRSITS